MTIVRIGGRDYTADGRWARRNGLAELTGFEPATFGVTSRHSNHAELQLRSRQNCGIRKSASRNLPSGTGFFPACGKIKWVLRDSNSRPPPCKGDVLPLN